MRRLLTLVLAVISLAGCGLVSSSGTFRSAQLPGADHPLAGAKVTVTSKEFTEALILGKITATYLSAAGAQVTDLTGAPGSAAARQALTTGAADIMWDYTGTAWQTYLNRTEAIADPHELWQRVHDVERRENDLEWLAPANFNDTYAFAQSGATAQRLGVRSLSDITKLPVRDRTFCVNDEFFSRSDGLLPMLMKYGIPYNDPNGVPSGNVTHMDSGVIYTATNRAAPCNFGMIDSTDGRVDSMNLTVLDDDKKFFLPYSGTAIVRGPVIDRYPDLRTVLAPISERLTDEVMRRLNGRVDVDGQDPADVAYDWLKSEHLIR
ncbi:MAG: glycine betaine ABC transporter substrate-binding protein [Nocardia sp.]|nr:glycine betaine ABC transporter substrate-binding protein [Nocardia sp.]